MDKVVLFDIDGTLSNIDHRIHFFESGDYERFHSLMHKDSINDWARRLAHMSNAFYKLIIITGRHEKHRDVTERWLKKHGIFYYKLYMRNEPEGFNDSSSKKKIYDDYITDKFEVIFVVDDRKHVVDMWRRIGLMCLQCAEGNY